jgi:tRNA (adenine22-N1)-methyltransferase
MPKLSLRLQTIYDHLIPGKPVWDFCCDHGYLGLYAYRIGRFPEVHFVDQVPEIIERLKVRFDSKHLQPPEFPSRAFFHVSAAEKINLPLPGTVVMAGVGSHTILDFLNVVDFSKTERIILGPQKDEELLLQSLQVAPGIASSHILGKNLEILEKERRRTLLVLDNMTQDPQ